MTQSTGCFPCRSRNSFAFLKCPQPKKPLYADSGLGWALVRTRCFFVSMRDVFDLALAPQRMKTNGSSLSFSFLPIAVAMLPKGVAGYAGAAGFIIYYLFPNFIFYFQDFKMFGLVFFMLLIYSLSLSIIFLLIAVGRLETMDYSKNSDV